MSTFTMRRTPASEMPHSLDLISKIALKAEALLGYSGLRKKLGVPPASLAHVLDELGIEPYHCEDVKQYKAEKACEVEEQIWAEFRKQIQVDLQEHGTLADGTFVRARWHTVPLMKYEGNVPEFALSRAIEIKERLPKAEFYVEELRVTKRYDPFLIVVCGRERFYIDVWDERDFEKCNF